MARHLVILPLLLALAACGGEHTQSWPDNGCDTCVDVEVEVPAQECTAARIAGGWRLQCDDGTDLEVRDGSDGRICSVVSSSPSSFTLECDDGLSATIDFLADGIDCTVTTDTELPELRCSDGSVMVVTPPSDGVDVAQRRIVGIAKVSTGIIHSGIDVKVDRTTFSASTDPSGAYEITGLPAGVFDLTFSSLGFETAHLFGVTVIEGTTQADEVVLRAGNQHTKGLGQELLHVFDDGAILYATRTPLGTTVLHLVPPVGDEAVLTSTMSSIGVQVSPGDGNHVVFVEDVPWPGENRLLVYDRAAQSFTQITVDGYVSALVTLPGPVQGSDSILFDDFSGTQHLDLVTGKRTPIASPHLSQFVCTQDGAHLVFNTSTQLQHADLVTQEVLPLGSINLEAKLSPNGHTVVFQASNGMVVAELQTHTQTLLPGAANDWCLADNGSVMAYAVLSTTEAFAFDIALRQSYPLGPYTSFQDELFCAHDGRTVVMPTDGGRLAVWSRTNPGTVERVLGRTRLRYAPLGNMAFFTFYDPVTFADNGKLLDLDDGRELSLDLPSSSWCNFSLDESALLCRYGVSDLERFDTQSGVKTTVPFLMDQSVSADARFIAGINSTGNAQVGPLLVGSFDDQALHVVAQRVADDQYQHNGVNDSTWSMTPNGEVVVFIDDPVGRGIGVRFGNLGVHVPRTNTTRMVASNVRDDALIANGRLYYVVDTDSSSTASDSGIFSIDLGL